jgi:uncharacterized membrane protein
VGGTDHTRGMDPHGPDPGEGDDPPGPGGEPAHGHVHVHSHDEPPVTSPTTQRLLVGIVAVLALVAVVGLVLLWPRADRQVMDLELGPDAELVRATVIDTAFVVCAGLPEGSLPTCQDVTFELESGVRSGETGSIQQTEDTANLLRPGDELVLIEQLVDDATFVYFFYEYQRTTPMLVLVAMFAAAVIALGRFQGVRALAGLGVTGMVLIGFLFPALLEGRSPVAAALVAAVVIALVSLYLTHGLNERTTVALLGALAALALTGVLAAVFAAATRLTGFGGEDALYLRVVADAVDIRGLVLAGIIIGSLGVLDDVTITQASAVWQLHRANPAYGLAQLYRSAVTIGRDHIASAVNTLVLAYAGAALPLLLYYTQLGRSLSDVAVREVVAVEIVRTLTGSIGLIAAVPLTTLLAAVVITRGTAGPGVVADPNAASGLLARGTSARSPAQSGAAVPAGGHDVAGGHGPSEDPEVDEGAWQRFAPEGDDDADRW